ncbi:YitT family protein [uncultured Alistipes sp.]|uniref:YitT family protein n=1 Tax=uncultured Alistipes sp. TaxID=538949 RepID=UPI00320A43DE
MKHAITPNSVWKIVKEYFLMFFGMMMYSFGWIGCVLPANGMGGGAAGLSLVLCTALENLGMHVQIGTMVFFINAVLLLVAGFIVGWNFGVKTIFCVLVISVGMNFWQGVLPEGNFLGVDNLLSIVMGGILAGTGIALCFTQGGSTGGTDIVAMIINKYRTISYGKILIYSDFVIIASSLLVGKGISAVIYGYVLTAVVGYTVDMIMAGNQQSSQVLIVTHDYEKMADAIAQNIHRGVTLIDSQGWYSKERSKIVMVVCRKRETAMILKFVKTIDPDAFMTVGSVMGVYGKGFQAINKG